MCSKRKEEHPDHAEEQAEDSLLAWVMMTVGPPPQKPDVPDDEVFAEQIEGCKEQIKDLEAHIEQLSKERHKARKVRHKYESEFAAWKREIANTVTNRLEVAYGKTENS